MCARVHALYAHTHVLVWKSTSAEVDAEFLFVALHFICESLESDSAQLAGQCSRDLPNSAP